MTEHDRWLARAVAELKRPVRDDSDARARLDRAWRSEGRLAGFNRGPSLLRPRRMCISPAGLAAAALLLLCVGGAAGWRLSRIAAPPPLVAETAVLHPMQMVTFIFLSPEAHSVALVGDFNEWRVGATPLARVAENGTWSVVLPLRPGRYTYAFLIDGREWRPDPIAPPAPEEEFGRPSSVVLVGSAT